MTSSRTRHFADAAHRRKAGKLLGCLFDPGHRLLCGHRIELPDVLADAVQI